MLEINPLDEEHKKQQTYKDKFSFLKLFNHVKGVGKPYKEDEIDSNWVEKKANPKQKKEWKDFYKYCDKIGIMRDKV